MLPFIPPIGYAETHYRMIPGLSFIYRKMPEILTDVPWRVDAGQNIPLLLMIKDADRFPVTMFNIEVALLSEKRKKIHTTKLLYAPVLVDQRMFCNIYEVPIPEDVEGTVFINTKIEIERKGKRRKILNDNYPFLSHRQMEVYVSKDKMPAPEGWHYGDCHYHSSYSSSHVEFGAPLDASIEMARAAGFSFFTLADHSYDLMCMADDYLKMDPACGLWGKQKKDIQENQREDFLVLQGEEVTCRNSKGRNVHLLAIGCDPFIKGSGDGARKWLKRKSEHSISEVMEIIHKNGGVGYGSHPCAEIGWVERAALKRGTWSEKDFLLGLDGSQFWDGAKCSSFFKARRQYTEMLLKGIRMNLLAGSDAHGDFNRVRKLKTPFLSLSEHDDIHFGRHRTCIQSPDLSRESLLESLRNGRYIVTEGPFADIRIDDNHLLWEAMSAREFGTLKRLRVFTGIAGADKETISYEVNWSAAQNCFKAEDRFAIPPKADYIRAEVISEAEGRELLAMTNPIWMD